MLTHLSDSQVAPIMKIHLTAYKFGEPLLQLIAYLKFFTTRVSFGPLRGDSLRLLGSEKKESSEIFHP